MSSVRAQEIRNMFRSLAPSPGTMGIQLTREEFIERSQIAKQLDPTGLELDELYAAIAGTITSELGPGMNRVSFGGLKQLMGWAAHMIVNAQNRFLSVHQPSPLLELFRLCICSMLAQHSPQTRKALEQSDPYGYQLLERASQATSYLSYPLLEAILRKRCARLLDGHGKARVDCQPHFSRNQLISNVGTVLRLVLDANAMPETSKDLHTSLAEVGAAISTAASYELQWKGKDWTAVVFDWRNDSLHAAQAIPTVGDAVLCLALLVGLDGAYPHPNEATYIRERDRQRDEVLRNPHYLGWKSFWPT